MIGPGVARQGSPRCLAPCPWWPWPSVTVPPQPDPTTYRHRCPTPPTPVRTRGGTPAPSYYYNLPYFLALLIGVWAARVVCCGCVAIVAVV